MRFSLSLNSEHGPTRRAVKLAKLAEEKGLECVWYCQDLFKRDVWVFLTAAATETDNIDLGTGIVNPFTENPAEIAMHAATLDEYSGGRARLGISIGAIKFLEWVGIEVNHPLSAMKESFEIIRNLLKGKRVEYSGKVFRDWTKDAYLRFEPLRRNIPLYLGAQSRRMTELIGEIADGGLPLLFPPEYFDVVLERVSRGAKRVGRSLNKIDLVGCVWFSVSENRESAKDALRELVTFYGPHLAPDMISKIGLYPEDFDQIKEAISNRDYKRAQALMTDEMANLAIHGTPEDCVERLEKLKDKGLEHIRFGPPLGSDPVKSIELIGNEILPHLQE